MARRNDLRNVAIIAHVDHGKTTLVDSLLKQAGSFSAHEKVKDRVMDSMDQERERGITIMAKNTGIDLGDVRVNIVDTPGHADFGGEVERTLHMVDGVLLLVDAAEGPLPQTRFVTEKALALGLTPILVINKCDRHDARPEEVLQEVYDLFIDLDASEEQLEFPVLFAVARDGWAVAGSIDGGVPEVALHPKVVEKDESRNLKPLFDAILKSIPGPEADADAPLQFLVNAVGYDDYVGRLAVGRVHQGTLKKNQQIIRHGADGIAPGKVIALWTFLGMGRADADEVRAGELVTVAGLPEVVPGDTITLVDGADPLPRFAVEEPTLSMMMQVNDSPFAGLEGKYVTSRHIRERLEKETRGNIALRVENTEAPDKFRIAGRGELSLAVLVESMRREGYEMALSRPQVVIKEEDGKKYEPEEGLVCDLPESAVGGVTLTIGKRGGRMHSMGNPSSGRVRVEYRIPTRGLIGFRNMFLTLTRGEGIMSAFFSEWIPYLGHVEARKGGAMIASETGKTTTYAIFNLQPRGQMFLKENTDVYEGMIVGEHARDNDIDINITKAKQLNNIRAAGKDEAQILVPAKEMRLEDSMEWIDMDELVEVTPKTIRLRKRVLKASMRPRRKKDKGKDKEAR